MTDVTADECIAGVAFRSTTTVNERIIGLLGSDRKCTPLQV